MPRARLLFLETLRISANKPESKSEALGLPHPQENTGQGWTKE